MVTTTMALIVGKAVLVADKDALPTPFRVPHHDLKNGSCSRHVSIPRSSSIARVIEAYIHYIVDTGRVIGFFPFLYDQFSWHRFMFVQLWIFVLFLIFTTGTEFNRLFGYGMLAKLFFRHRSSQFKLSRRDRIRTLVQLSRITERHSIDEFEDPSSEPNHRMVKLLKILAADARSHPTAAAQ